MALPRASVRGCIQSWRSMTSRLHPSHHDLSVTLMGSRRLRVRHRISWESTSMRSRLVILVVAVVIAVAAALFGIGRLVSFSAGSGGASGSLPAAPASYLGVYESGALDNYQPVADFTGVAGRQPNLVGYYSGWGEAFQTSFAKTAYSHGAATIMQWDPTLASVTKIAAGGYDGYLRSFAASVRVFGHPVVIGFGHEM